MSDSKQIVHFLFWISKIWQIGNVILGIATVNGWQTISWIMVGLIIFSTIIELTYLYKKYHIISLNPFDALYFTKDERDRVIAQKVHSHVMITDNLLIILLILLVTLLWQNHSGLSLQEIFYFLFAWLGIAIIIPDIQYYVLWNKYDQD